MATFEPFHIDTKGLCLICLSECSGKGSQANSTSESILDSSINFKMFLRYLDLSIYDMYNFSPSFLQSIGATESTSQLEASLCASCSEKTKKFAKLYLDMELIRMNLDKVVQSLYSAMRKSASDHRSSKEFRRRLKMTKTMMGMVNASAAEKLREEAMQKCSIKLDGLESRAAMLQKDVSLFSRRVSTDSSSASVQIRKEESRSRLKPGPRSKTFTSCEDSMESSPVVKSEPTTTLEMNATNFTFPDLNGEQFSGIMEGGNDPLGEEGEGPRILCSSSSAMGELVFNPEVQMENENEDDEAPEETKETIYSQRQRHSKQSAPSLAYNYVTKRGRKPVTVTGPMAYVLKRNRNGLFECPSCKKGFKSSSHCRRHYETIHLNMRKYKCNVCALTFKRVEQLKAHFTSRHQGFQYRCPYCPKSSPHEKVIKSHILAQHAQQHDQEQANMITTTRIETTCSNGERRGEASMENLDLDGSQDNEDQELNFLF